MTINQLAHNSTNAHNSNLPKTASEKTQEKATTMATDNVDKFDANSVNVNRNYQTDPDRTDFRNVQGYKGKSTLQMKNAVMADFVHSNISQQAGKSFWEGILNNTTFTPKAFALDAYKAAEASSEKYEDYWGVEAVAQRLVTFAKSLAGDRDDLFDKMKNAFLKGFNLASGAANGKLPDISNQTKARTLELFDEWEAEIKARKNPSPIEE